MDPREALSPLLNKLTEHSKIKEFLKALATDSLLFESLWSAPKALIAYLASQATQKHLVILTEDETQNQLISDLAFFFQTPPIHFLASEMLPSETGRPSSDIVGERFKALKQLSQNNGPHIVVSSLKAAFEKVVEPNSLNSLFLHLHVKQPYGLKALQEKLSSMGYLATSLVYEKGQFALRGGIIDLFPSTSPLPYRIEFFGDEIASMRSFDPTSQLSKAKVETLTITPSDERRFLQIKEKEATLFDYLGDNVLLIFDKLVALEESFTTLGLNKSHPFFVAKEDFFGLTAHLQKIFFTQERLENLSEVKFIDRGTPSVTWPKLSFELFSESFEARRSHIPFYPLKARFFSQNMTSEAMQGQILEEMLKSPIDLFFVTATASDWEFLKTHMKDIEVKATVHRVQGALSSSLFLAQSEVALVSSHEFTHRMTTLDKQQQATTPYVSSLPMELFSLEMGESVVHLNSGIGRYLGIERRKNHLGIETEFLIVEYADAAKLYVPIEQANLINKYIGAGSERPELHTLGSTRWKNTLQRSEQAILDYAADLLELEAARAHHPGFAYPEDSELMHQFASEFAYQETPDQKTAIEQVIQDMKKPKAMDRLVCGDVGYGKTEVAMRAAFKAAADGGKQVAVLVPTTVLAMQHFETFSARMSGFPIKVAVLSRFVSAKEVAKTCLGLEEGTIDIVIGTHRLISADISFKRLGLIIIDEEQRFGVKAKDHLKQLKKDVDCLTLSATPIPRTLYLSLVGARDMSLINTPPLNRLAIATTIAEASNEILASAIVKELARDGQIYVIHNRIESIYELASRISKLVPEAKIAVAHGDMSANDLDSIFHAFKTHQANVLVSTAIIENGIDIPNANTILIDRADHFGLADLYQIRGRVGRSHRKAYCYFLVRDMRALSEVSKRRLSAIASSAGLGGGMKIAMFDLEIRGAGNMLGTAQSGHVTSIGFTLYCKLLKRAIAKLKDKKEPLALTEVKIDLPFDARLPEEYIHELSLRLDLYQRLGEAENEEQLGELQTEIIDRFGPLPKPAEWLMAVNYLRLFAASNRFTLVKLGRLSLEAEQTLGPKKKISKKLLLQPLKSPSEINKIISLLKENFPLP